MTTIGCIRAQMGSTTYYVAKMRAGQLIDSVGFAMEMTEWDQMSADEKMQRQLDTNRVISEIVPYIVEDADRFFGSLIVDIYSGFENLEFESVIDVAPGLPAAYRVPMKDMGFLTLPGNERLIALDGQHRLLSLKIAIKGVMGIPAGTKILDSWKKLDPHPELANEEVSVIFVEHRDNLKIRKIFNKVNKYARQTSRSDNIITSDDDILAVISRKLITEGEPLAPIGSIDVVNWKSNTLSQRSKHLSTLSALYTIADTLLKDERFSTNVLPSEERLEEAYAYVSHFWKVLLDGLSVFTQYMALTRADRPVSVLREQNLLMKPITQMALAHVARTAKAKNIPWEEIVRRLDRVNWSFDNELWFNILVIGSANRKMITGKESVRSAGIIISYLVMGNVMTQSEIAEVRSIFCNAKNDESVSLPAMVEAD